MLDDKMTHLKQDMTLYRRQHDKKGVMMRCKCSYKYLNFKEPRTKLLTYLAVFVLQLVSLVAEQLISNEKITSWKVALKEIHAALNTQVIFVTFQKEDAKVMSSSSLSSGDGSPDEHSY